MLAALLSNAIQGTVLGTPLSEEAEAQGMRVLVDMRDLPIDMMSSYVTTTRPLVARDPDLVQRFLMAYLEGMQLARDDPALAVEAIMRGSGDTNRAHAEAAYAVYRPVWDPWPSAAGIQGLLDYMDEPEAKTARPEEMIDLGPLRELERTAGSPRTSARIEDAAEDVSGDQAGAGGAHHRRDPGAGAGATVPADERGGRGAGRADQGIQEGRWLVDDALRDGFRQGVRGTGAGPLTRRSCACARRSGRCSWTT